VSAACPTPRRKSTHLRVCGCRSLVILLVTGVFAAIFYHTEKAQEWSLVDAWYFAVTTIATVG